MAAPALKVRHEHQLVPDLDRSECASHARAHGGRIVNASCQQRSEFFEPVLSREGRTGRRIAPSGAGQTPGFGRLLGQPSERTAARGTPAHAISSDSRRSEADSSRAWVGRLRAAEEALPRDPCS